MDPTPLDYLPPTTYKFIVKQQDILTTCNLYVNHIYTGELKLDHTTFADMVTKLSAEVDTTYAINYNRTPAQRGVKHYRKLYKS